MRDAAEELKMAGEGWKVDSITEKTGKYINDLILDSNEDWVPQIKEWANKQLKQLKAKKCSGKEDDEKDVSV